MVSLTQLEYLVAVDRERHFGRAAKACHVSQPSLSTQIQKLEEELNIIVFDRTRKPIFATDVGAQIVKQAQVVLKEHRRLLGIASDAGGELTGSFELAVIPTLSPYLLPHFLSDFSRKYPNVNIRVNEYKTDDIIQKLEADELDAAILVTPLGHDRIIERHLFFEPFYGYLGLGHPLSKKKTLGEKDLLGEDLWLLEEGHCFRDQVLKVCSLDRRSSVLGNVEFSSGSLETLKNLVRSSQGYTLLPELAVLGLSDEEKSKYVKRFQKPVPTREVSLVHSRVFLKEGIIEALESTILENLPKKIRSLKTNEIEVVDL